MNDDVVSADFAALGSRHPRAAARPLVAATAECALMEFELGRRDPDARAALSELVG
jgi:TetR/AcrR family transcriptional repressor of nem operon